MRRAAANVLWSGFEAGASAVLSFISAFVVARLIGPAELGIGAAAVAVHVLLWVGVNALFADALVQRAEVDDIAASSAFWSAAAVGLAAALIQAGAGWPLARALGDSRLTPMALALALPLPLVGAGGAVQGLLTRQRAYHVLAGRTVIGQGFGTLAGVAAALGGAGAWALVLQQLVGSSAGALALLVRARWRPRAVWHWRPVRDLLRIGLPLTGSTLVLHGRYRLFALLIGATEGAALLGQVHMAFRLADTVRELVTTALWRLMLPGLAERQHDLPALRAQVDRLLAISGVVVFPLCGAMAVAVRPLTALLLGPAWAPAGLAALPLLALSAWLFLGFPAGVAVVARGAAHYTLAANLAATVVLVVGVVLIRPAQPLDAALLWVGAQALVAPYTLWVNARVLYQSALRPIGMRAGLVGRPRAKSKRYQPATGYHESQSFGRLVLEGQGRCPWTPLRAEPLKPLSLGFQKGSALLRVQGRALAFLFSPLRAGLPSLALAALATLAAATAPNLAARLAIGAGVCIPGAWALSRPPSPLAAARSG